MSILNWFGKRTPPRDAEPSHDSSLGHADATLPNHALIPAPARSTDASQRRNERVERRELLYGVVRECMNAAGVLSASYKFKVLSLDSSGRKYLVMMDVPRAYLADPAQFSGIEGAIARSAKERYSLLVTAVYWRVNELVSTSAAPLRPLPQGARADAVAAPRAAAVPPPASQATAAAAPGDVQDEEMQAFRRARAAAARGDAAAAQSEQRSGARQAPAQPDFCDTQPFDNMPPLGPSQFGGLN